MSSISKFTYSTEIFRNLAKIGFENSDLDMQSLTLSGRMTLHASLIFKNEVILNPDHNGVIGIKLNFVLAKNSVAQLGRQLFPHFRFSPLPLFTCFTLLAWMVSGSIQAASLHLTSSSDYATAGYFQLTWSWPDAPADTIYQLDERQLSDDHSNTVFKTIYQGIDQASVISGKSDGRYEYRVVAMANSNKLPASATSNLISVEVKHHSLANAFGVLSLGVVIFIAILITIFRGVNQTD